MNINILIVDADRSTRDALCRRLENDGYGVVAARSAEEALEQCRRHSFPLVLSDTALEGTGGIGLLERIKLLRPETIVALMTRLGTLESAVDALRHGAFDYVEKPVEDFEPLVRLVQRAVGKWTFDLQERERIARLESMANHLREANASLRDLADHDGLTGLFNQRYFREMLDSEIVRCRRYRRIFSLLFADVDRFKSYNDRHGHLAGDNLLRGLARFLQQACRQSDIVARYGGDEFVLLLPETPTDGALLLAERLCTQLAGTGFPQATGDPLPHVTLSVGLCSYPVHGEEALDLLDRADRALYEAKRSGRNRASCWCPSEEQDRGIVAAP